MLLSEWQALFATPLDTVGFLLWVLVFPVYHGIYPWLMKLFPGRAAKVRLDVFRRSWIERLVEGRDILAGAQQTRNLTMVNSLLASSALILMGFTANLLIQLPRVEDELPVEIWAGSHQVVSLKVLLLIMVFGVSFAYCMTALRHLGHFNLVLGADPDLLAEHEGSAVDYLSALINRASNRSTLGVRSLYSATPLFLWLFDVHLFVLVTVLWGIKFLSFQDFARVFGRRVIDEDSP